MRGSLIAFPGAPGRAAVILRLARSFEEGRSLDQLAITSDGDIVPSVSIYVPGLVCHAVSEFFPRYVKWLKLSQRLRRRS
jgi:hypothetical protein